MLACVRDMVRISGQPQFTLRDFQARYTDALAAQYPQNHHVPDKIRQQLQVLRDAGILAFVDNRGTYRVIA